MRLQRVSADRTPRNPRNPESDPTITLQRVSADRTPPGIWNPTTLYSGHPSPVRERERERALSAHASRMREKSPIFVKPKLSISNVNAISDAEVTSCPYCHELVLK